jgi:hypothetical protein
MMAFDLDAAVKDAASAIYARQRPEWEHFWRRHEAFLDLRAKGVSYISESAILEHAKELARLRALNELESRQKEAA